MADKLFEDARLARLYDPLDPDRADLDYYAALVEEFGGQTVLDVGAGTGAFACLLASKGLDVIAVEPAAASLAIARTKPFADCVRWIHGDALSLPALSADVVTMTANVAQVFVDESEWLNALRAARTALKPGGHLMFETRVPVRQAWLDWNRQASHRRTVVPDLGPVESWVDTLHADGSLVTFRWTFVFEADGATLTSDSTLRFRERHEIESALAAVGFLLQAVRDAPDRPGREWIFVAQRPE